MVPHKKIVNETHGVSCNRCRRETICHHKSLDGSSLARANGSSLAGAKLSFKPSSLSIKTQIPQVWCRGGQVLRNTTGQWDLHGSDAPSPYNPLQRIFFETFAAPFSKRGLLLKILNLGGGSLLTYVSASSTGDVLPIKRGPQEKPNLGPRGKL